MYKRVISLTYSRVVAYGEKWRLWCNKNKNTKQNHVIPKKHQKKILVKQGLHGGYEVHDHLISEIKRLGMTVPDNWRY